MTYQILYVVCLNNNMCFFQLCDDKAGGTKTPIYSAPVSEIGSTHSVKAGMYLILIQLKSNVIQKG